MISDDLRTVEIARHHGGQVSYHPAGRFLIRDGSLHHLEDYHNLLHGIFPEGPIDKRTALRLVDFPKHSSYFKVHSLRHDPKPEEPKTIQEEKPGTLPSVFEYRRVGMDQPHTVEFQQGKALLDGNALTDGEVSAILGNVKSGAGSIRYKANAPQAIAKAERFLARLAKAEGGEMDPHEAFKHLQSAVESGVLPHGAEKALRRLVYEDPMVQGVGNRFAYNDFLSRPREGVHIRLDANDFREINNRYGHEVGDEAIKAMGNAVRDAAHESLGEGQSKVFKPDLANYPVYRHGGDEMHVHVPSMEHAAKFARALHNKLNELPPIGGAHQMSVSMGFGHTPEHADAALYEAKKGKVGPTGERAHEVGKVPNLAHSLVPGNEGPIPLSQPPAINPPVA